MHPNTSHDYRLVPTTSGGRESSITRETGAVLSFSRTVRFSGEIRHSETQKQLMKILNRDVSLGASVLILLVLALCPIILSGFISTLFFSDEIITVDCVRCSVEELESTNWTFAMIQNISSFRHVSKTNRCYIHDRNYGQLKDMSYQTAVMNLKRQSFRMRQCHKVVYKEGCGYYLNRIYKRDCLPFNINDITMVFSIGAESCTYIISGIAADVFGRKIVLQVNAICCIVTLLLATFVQFYWFFIPTMAICVATIRGASLIAFIMFIETLPYRMRPYMSQIVLAGPGVSYIGSVFLRVFVNHSKYHMIMYLAFSIITIFGIWYVPESPRWLITQHKYGKVCDVLEQLNTDYPSIIRDCEEQPSERSTIKHQIYILTRKRLRKCILCNSFLLMVAFTTYSTGGDIVLKQKLSLSQFLILLGFFKLLRPLYNTVFLFFLGRRFSICSACIFAGLAFSISIINPKVETIAVIIIAALGTCCYSLVLLYTVELYPVMHSGTIIGFIHSIGYIPIFLIGVFRYYVYGEGDHTLLHFLKLVFNLMAAVIVLYMPETSTTSIPLTDVQAVKQSMKKSNTPEDPNTD